MVDPLKEKHAGRFCISKSVECVISSFSYFFERPKKEAKKSFAEDAFATTLIPCISRNPSRSGFMAIWIMRSFAVPETSGLLTPFAVASAKANLFILFWLHQKQIHLTVGTANAHRTWCFGMRCKQNHRRRMPSNGNDATRSVCFLIVKKSSCSFVPSRLCG